MKVSPGCRSQVVDIDYRAGVHSSVNPQHLHLAFSTSISRDWKGKKDIVLLGTYASDPINRRKRMEWGRNGTRV